MSQTVTEEQITTENTTRPPPPLDLYVGVEKLLWFENDQEMGKQNARRYIILQQAIQDLDQAIQNANLRENRLPALIKEVEEKRGELQYLGNLPLTIDFFTGVQNRQVYFRDTPQIMTDPLSQQTHQELQLHHQAQLQGKDHHLPSPYLSRE